MNDSGQVAKTSFVGYNTLESVFKDHMSEIYWAQKHFRDTYESLSLAAFYPELKRTFEDHRNECMLQIDRLEQCLGILELVAGTNNSEGYDGLGQDVIDIIADYPEGYVRDAAIIAAAQRVQHYGISSYGTLRTLANVLGRVQCAALLEECKDEEAEMDEKLTRLADEVHSLALGDAASQTPSNANV